MGEILTMAGQSAGGTLVLSGLFSASRFSKSRTASLARFLHRVQPNLGLKSPNNPNKETSMAIQKKSLISTLKTTKKANVAKEEFAPATKDGVTTRKVVRNKAVRNKQLY